MFLNNIMIYVIKFVPLLILRVWIIKTNKNIPKLFQFQTEVEMFLTKTII